MAERAPGWKALPPARPLLEGEVDVWCVSLNVPEAQLGILHGYLEADERKRVRRLRFERDQHRFIAARGTLRALLAHYLRTDPARLRFRYGPCGKPELTGARGPDAIRFNLSHSRDLALVAITRGREIGVDLEFIHPTLAPELVAGQFFAAEEVAALTALPASSRREAFFACWTRKEAYLKARGDGLSVPLHHFSVSLTPGAPAALLWVKGDPDARSRWTLGALSPSPDYVGALALQGALGRCVCRRIEW